MTAQPQHSTAPGEPPLRDSCSAVPPHYDLVNAAMTLGLDRVWRREAVQECLAGRPRRVLDLGCGTGDLACALAMQGGSDVEVTGLDASEPMLALARRKAASQPGCRVTFLQGDTAALPFADGHFDVVGIAFAFRNLVYKNPRAEQHLKQILRVLVPGGRLVALETSQPGNPVVRRLYHLFLHGYAVGASRLLSEHDWAYRYLAESAAHFYKPAAVQQLLTRAGFRTVQSRPLMLGAIGLHVAEK